MNIDKTTIQPSTYDLDSTFFIFSHQDTKIFNVREMFT